MKNQDRHLIKWNYTRPEYDLAVNIFRIQIPHLELRINPHFSTNKKVKWISGITHGTYQFDFCLTKPAEANPCEERVDLPHQVLDCLRLADKRWLVIFYQAVGLTPNDIDDAKKSVIKEMKEKNVNIESDESDRWIAVFGKSDDGVPIIMELYYDNPA